MLREQLLQSVVTNLYFLSVSPKTSNIKFHTLGTFPKTQSLIDQPKQKLRADSISSDGEKITNQSLGFPFIETYADEYALLRNQTTPNA